MGLAVQCAGCGARFALSDELFQKKVRGRKVHIRCKNCGDRIPVDATEGTRPDITWMVSYGETDDREMSSTEVAAALARGELDAATLVWAEGMSEWLPIASIPELAGTSPRSKPKPKPTPAKLPSQGGATPPPAPSPPELELKAGTPTASAPLAPRDAARESDDTGGIFDAENARSIRPKPAEVASGKDAPRARTPQAPKPRPNKARRQSDAEILGLAASAPETRGASPEGFRPGPDPSAPRSRHSDSPQQGAAAPGRPEPATPHQSRAARRILGVPLAGLFGAIVLALGAWAISSGQQRDTAADGSQPASLESSRAVTSAPASAPDAPPPEPLAPPSSTSPVQAGLKAPAKSPVLVSSAKPGLRAGATPAAAGPVSKAARLPAPSTQAAFDRSAASAALSSAAAKASACRKPGDPSGTATVTVVFAPSGRVTSAIISGPPFAGTATGGCIAATLRRASVPAFSGDRVTVTKRIVVQ